MWLESQNYNTIKASSLEHWTYVPNEASSLLSGFPHDPGRNEGSQQFFRRHSLQDLGDFFACVKGLRLRIGSTLANHLVPLLDL
jgi:hypothetical protein